MEKIVVRGGNRLCGSIKISGAKNAVLPIITATMLATTPCTLEEIPNLEDVRTICETIGHLGIRVERKDASSLYIDGSAITTCEAPYELVRKCGPLFWLWGRS